MPTVKKKAIDEAIARQKEYGLKVYDIEPGESLEHAYKRMAKVSNQRLVRLERLDRSNSEFTGVKQFAYTQAMKNIEIAYGDGHHRFNETKIPTDQLELMDKINIMRKFLNSQTSTKSGIIKTWQARAKTFNKNNETNFTWQEIAAFYESGKDERLDAKFRYKNALYFLNLTASDPEIEDKIRAASKKNIKVSTKEGRLEKIADLLTKSGLDAAEILDIAKMTDEDFVREYGEDAMRKVINKRRRRGQTEAQINRKKRRK